MTISDGAKLFNKAVELSYLHSDGNDEILGILEAVTQTDDLEFVCRAHIELANYHRCRPGDQLAFRHIQKALGIAEASVVTKARAKIIATDMDSLPLTMDELLAAAIACEKEYPNDARSALGTVAFRSLPEHESEGRKLMLRALALASSSRGENSWSVCLELQGLAKFELQAGNFAAARTWVAKAAAMDTLLPGNRPVLLKRQIEHLLRRIEKAEAEANAEARAKSDGQS